MLILYLIAKIKALEMLNIFHFLCHIFIEYENQNAITTTITLSSEFTRGLPIDVAPSRTKRSYSTSYYPFTRHSYLKSFP